MPVTNGTEYIFVVLRTGTLNDTNKYNINYVAAGYASGDMYYYDGVWNQFAGYDVQCVITHVTTTGLTAVASGRINRLPQSETFDVAPWGPSSASITANDIASPFGTITADRLNNNAALTSHYVYQSGSGYAINAQVHTASVYAKAGTVSWFQFQAMFGGIIYWANFNLCDRTGWLDIG